MAEFLIKAIDSTHSDSIKDERGCYKRGDIVVVMPDGHSWGKEEHPKTTTNNPPKFFIVKVPGITVEQAKKYIEEQKELQIKERIWIKKEFDKALITNNFGEFESQPEIIEEMIETVNTIVTQEKWEKMQQENNFGLFNSVPIASNENGNIKLTGELRLVKLRGLINETITRRNFKLLIDNMPNSIGNFIKNNGEITITFNQIKNYIQNKKTGLIE